MLWCLFGLNAINANRISLEKPHFNPEKDALLDLNQNLSDADNQSQIFLVCFLKR